MVVSSITILTILSSCGSPSSDPPSIRQPQSLKIEQPVVGKSSRDIPALINIRFDRLSIEHGLSQSDVIAMLQDRTGYMWFGTEDGLNKYDGQKFTIFRHDPDNPHSLSDNWIWSLYEDHLGSLWIGTLAGGLDLYNEQTGRFTHYRHDPDDPQSLRENEVLVIYEDNEDTLWIGTRSGLDRFDRTTGFFSHYGYNTGAVFDIIQTSDGFIWFSTERGGLFKLDTVTGKSVQIAEGTGRAERPENNIVRVIYENSKNELLIGTDAGLGRLENGAFIPLENTGSESIRAIFEDPYGKLWFGTQSDGLFRLDSEKGILEHYKNDHADPHSLSHPGIHEIYQDREGVLWIGTNGGGINKIFLEGIKFSYYSRESDNPYGLNDDHVRGIYQDDTGTLWVGTSDGLNQFDPESGNWYHYRHKSTDPSTLTSNVIGDIQADKEGNLWIGTFGDGLNRFDPKTSEIVRFQEDPDNPLSLTGRTVTDIYLDRQERLWVGTLEGGLNLYNRQKDGFDHYRNIPGDLNSINSDAVMAVYEDREGIFWIGTFGSGMTRFDKERNTFHHFTADPAQKESLSNNLVSVIYEDTGGSLWIGTAGGLNKLDRNTGIFKHYREKNGLTSDLVYGILEDSQGDLWLSTNNGLFLFDPLEERFQSFDVHDGLQGGEFNSFSYFKSENGELFFGGINGLNSFFPERISSLNRFIPNIEMTLFTRGGEKIDIEWSEEDLDQITLRWPGNFFEFEFAALSYANPAANQYAYMLEGLDTDWIMMGNRGYGRYTNLPGGSYTLKMIGSNNDGVWNEMGRTVNIRIVPPFWQRWIFRIGTLFVCAAAILALFRLRVRRIETRNRELEELVAKRTAELTNRAAAEAVAEERGRLARELHDSVTQSLHGSTMLAEAGHRLAQAGEFDRAKGYFSRLGEISQQALKEMRLLVYELRPAAIGEIGLAEALRQRLEVVERRSGVEVQLQIESSFKLPENTEHALYRIAQEALNNALKHSKSEHIDVSIKVDKNPPAPRLILEVSDKGRGFDPDEAGTKSGIGLTSIRERTTMLGGTLEINTKPGKGTSIRVMIDIKEENHG
jgi:signal transduction histidine kinase/ligand-binding sensor domain-containing protein